MTTVFPTNNLPTAAQPWAREVQKQLSNVIASDNSERINNTARDNQLNSSIVALTGVVADVQVATAAAQAAADDAQDAINGLTGLGSAGSPYSIYANNISGGTITGITIQTASSGQRIVLGGTTMDFYSPGGTYSGKIVQEGGDAVPSVAIESSSGSNYVQVWNSGARMVGDVSTVTAFSGQVYLAASLVSTSSSFTSGGVLTASSLVYFPGIDSSTSAANMRWGTGGPGKVQYSTASSRRFKNTIVPISEEGQLDPKKLLDIPVVAFKYNEDYLSSDDSRFNKMIPGFIAEDIEQIYQIAAEADGIGATDWNPRYVIPGMLALIQELYTKIETLEKGA